MVDEEPGQRRAHFRSKHEADVDPVQLLDAMIRQGHSLILFPEGTRGVPVMADFKRGVGHLASRHPDVPVIPVYLDGFTATCPRAGPSSCRWAALW